LDESEVLRGLSVRLSLRRDGVTAELQLGDAAKFYPTDAALASWMAQADKGLAQVVYE
jgi:DNA polymerase-3 subunit alpha